MRIFKGLFRLSLILGIFYLCSFIYFPDKKPQKGEDIKNISKAIKKRNKKTQKKEKKKKQRWKKIKK